MRITIVYDNEARLPELRADHGFSCLVECGDAPPLLFDTGARGRILKHNLSVLGIDLCRIGVVFISHDHSDHTGGLEEVLREAEHPAVFRPASSRMGVAAPDVTRVSEACQIGPGMFSTGELQGIEQSLVVTTDEGSVVVVGCAHPGLGSILSAASQFGSVRAVIGGLHGFREFALLDPLSLVCPCHCTVYKAEIRRLFRGRCPDCGVGTVLEL